MQVYLISGKAQHGKDTSAEQLKELLQARGERVLITHYADQVKYICRSFFDWDGNKDEFGRSLLQYVGTDIVRAKRPDYWVDFICDMLKLFPDDWDYVIIPDTRFPNEVSKVKALFDALLIRVVRPGFSNNLTEEQRQHPSETALDNIAPDYVVVNDGSIENLKAQLADLIGD